jgi:hypothetical protein
VPPTYPITDNSSAQRGGKGGVLPKKNENMQKALPVTGGKFMKHSG